MSTRPMVEIEKVTIVRALIEAGYNVRAAAKTLKVSRNTIYRRLQRWGIPPPMFSGRAGARVLRKDFVTRCMTIRKSLEEATDEQTQGAIELLHPKPRGDGGAQQ